MLFTTIANLKIGDILLALVDFVLLITLHMSFKEITFSHGMHINSTCDTLHAFLSMPCFSLKSVYCNIKSTMLGAGVLYLPLPVLLILPCGATYNFIGLRYFYTNSIIYWQLNMTYMFVSSASYLILHCFYITLFQTVLLVSLAHHLALVEIFVLLISCSELTAAQSRD